MNRKAFWFFRSVFVLSAMLVLSLGYAQAQITGFIPVFVDEFGNEDASVIFQDANGNIGIGTTAAPAQLKVVGCWDCGSGSIPALQLSGEKPTIQFIGDAASGNRRWLLHLGSNGPGNLEFFRDGSSTPVMALQPNDNVGIGTTTPLNQLHIEGNVPTFNGTSIRLFNQAGFNTNPWILGTGGGVIPADSFSIGDSFDYKLIINPNGRTQILGHLAVNGSNNVSNGISLPNIGNPEGRGIANRWDTYSSRRWKTNIQTIQGALEKVERLRGVSFDWKEKGGHDIGLIAEEVGEVVPEVVGYEENGKDARSVDYARLTALLIEAVKAQQSQVRELKAELEELKAGRSEIASR